MSYSFAIIGTQDAQLSEMVESLRVFSNYDCIGTLNYSEDIAAKLMRLKPQLVFVIKNKADEAVSLKPFGEALFYLAPIPYLVAISDTASFALEAIQNGLSDYLTDTRTHALGMALAKFEKRFSHLVPQSICIKSYSDYHLIKYTDIVYLKADNNSTDFKLCMDKTITAYKTLKYFEETLPGYFVRIHKSYIVNIHCVSRIHFSKNRCYLNFNEQLPFSATYREKVEQILNDHLTS